MGLQPEYSKLCHLIHRSLQPWQYVDPNSLTKETEKNILISLSQVLRHVKQWTNDIDSQSDSGSSCEETGKFDDSVGCFVDSALHLESRDCFAKIVGDLMVLLALDSPYIKHLAGNTLVAISEFVVACESHWDDFMHIICRCLELAICNTLSSSCQPSPSRVKHVDTSNYISSMTLKLKNANCSMIAAAFRVLRNILKYLKRDFDGVVIKAYLESISYLLSSFPWKLLSEFNVSQSADALRGSDGDFSLCHRVIFLKETSMFYGNLFQFFCSLVEQSSLLENELDSLPLTCEISNLVPRLLSLCHGELDNDHVRISQYLRHKALMLMIRLTSRNHLDSPILSSWLYLVHKHFEDLLLQPIPEKNFNPHASLEGSPFCTSFVNPEKQNMSSGHLQRLAIFVFLKCSLTLISVKGSNDENHTENLNIDSDSYCGSEGLMDVHKWLQVHVPEDIFLNNEIYSERCVEFTTSFIQLYMHEDDLLFQTLLQLLCVPFYPNRRIVEGVPISEVKNQLLILVSDLFNPIHLFYLFLAEILYDYQVLLDYLISKDTGASCAEYLLRSLRIICDSWSSFVQFPDFRDGLNESFSKRRKVLGNVMQCKHDLASRQLENGRIFSSPDGSQKSQVYAMTHSRTCRLPFEAARDCLLSLKTSIENLHQRNLFPYNPQVLLRRLMRFEDLCLKP